MPCILISQPVVALSSIRDLHRDLHPHREPRTGPAPKRNDDPSICIGSRHFIARLPKQPAVFLGRYFFFALALAAGFLAAFFAAAFFAMCVPSLPRVCRYVFSSRTNATPKHGVVRKFSARIPCGCAGEKDDTRSKEGREEERQTPGKCAIKNVGFVAEVNIIMDALRFISDSYCR